MLHAVRSILQRNSRSVQGVLTTTNNSCASVSHANMLRAGEVPVQHHLFSQRTPPCKRGRGLRATVLRSHSSLAGYRGEIVHFLSDPAKGPKGSYEHFEDGILLVENGKVVHCGESSEVLRRFTSRSIEVKDCRPGLIMPGFIDAHIHFPQIDMIGSHGEQLLEWLNKYTFPAEAKFSSFEHATNAAEAFVAELLRNGTTTALAFCTMHEHSVDALFMEAQKREMLMIAGKVLMDAEPYAPAELRMEAQESYEASKRLIERWHGNGRCLYAVTPRFAITSTSKQLELAGQLLREHPGVYMHTHMNENKNEIELTKKIHQVDNYIDAYGNAGLLGPRSVLAHCVHMTDEDWGKMRQSGSAACHCPSSNLFLGSGLFPMREARKHGVKVGLGTDVGAGTSFCQLASLDDAYKVGQLQGQPLSPLAAFHLATLGTAEALSLDGSIGNLAAGKAADFLVLDLHATPLMEYRMRLTESVEEKLFLLSTLGDDRSIKHTYCNGKLQHDRDAPAAPSHSSSSNWHQPGGSGNN